MYINFNKKDANGKAILGKFSVAKYIDKVPDRCKNLEYLYEKGDSTTPIADVDERVLSTRGSFLTDLDIAEDLTVKGFVISDKYYSTEDIFDFLVFRVIASVPNRDNSLGMCIDPKYANEKKKFRLRIVGLDDYFDSMRYSSNIAEGESNNEFIEEMDVYEKANSMLRIHNMDFSKLDINRQKELLKYFVSTSESLNTDVLNDFKANKFVNNVGDTNVSEHMQYVFNKFANLGIFDKKGIDYGIELILLDIPKEQRCDYSDNDISAAAEHIDYYCKYNGVREDVNDYLDGIKIKGTLGENVSSELKYITSEDIATATTTYFRTIGVDISCTPIEKAIREKLPDSMKDCSEKVLLDFIKNNL